MTTVRKLGTTLGAVVLATAIGTTAQASPQQQDQANQNQKQKPHKQGYSAQPGPMDSKITFEFDSSEIDQQAQSQLDELAQWAQENEQREIFIAGHTDPVGTEQYNMNLGERRAEAAKRYLVNQGVSPDRIVTRSYGEKYTKYEEPSENRRAVFFAEREQTGQAAQQQQQQGQQQQAQEDPDLYVTEYDVTVEDTEPDVAAVAVETPEQQRQREMQMQQQPRTTQTTYEPATKDDRADHLITPIGLSVSVGGGAIGFLDDEARDFTDVGGSWDARLVVGTRTPIAFEAGYTGSAQDIEALGLDDNSVLLGTHAEGAARLNILQQLPVQPYIFAGLGYGRYDIVNSDFNTSNVADDDNFGYVPLGAGFGFRAGGFLVDVRGTLRAAFEDDLVSQTAASDEEVDLDSWNASAKVGWEF